MILFKNSIIYFEVVGLNFKKFIEQLKKENIEIFDLQKLEYNCFKLGIKIKDKNTFLKISNNFHYNLKECILPLPYKIGKIIKSNLAIIITSMLLICSFFVLNNFVLQIRIYGLENLTSSEVLKVLDDFGYERGKFKSDYDLDGIEKVLTSNLDKISFASAVIKGNTLIVNINEKIDNSDFIYDYKPIIAPFNCIIEEISLLSGTAMLKVGDVVKKGENIISPYIYYQDNSIIYVPAKATIKAYVEVSNYVEVDKTISSEEKKKIIEENINKLYNEFNGYKVLSDYDEIVMEKESDESLLLTIFLKTIILF